MNPSHLLPVCLILGVGALSALADPIAGVDFEDAGDTGYDRTPDDLDVDDGITVSADWTVFGGVDVTPDPNANANATSGSFATKLNQGSADADPPLTAPTDHYYSWSITIPGNVILDLTNITFNLRQGTGTQNQTRWAIFNTSLDNGGPGGDIVWSLDNPVARTDWEDVDVDLSGATYQGLTGTTVTFYWYNQSSGSDVDSIVLNGTATTVEVDDTPPDPSPMTWLSVPSAENFFEISMTATTATDPNMVEYYFSNTSIPDQSHDSGWQDSPTYTDTDLQADTSYAYTVKARDKSADQNETLPSSEETVTTPVDTSIVLYNISSFNNSNETANVRWIPGITTIAVAPGLSGTDDAGLLALQTMSEDPTTDTGGGDRFRNTEDAQNNVRETVTTDPFNQGIGGDGYLQFGIDDGGNGTISLSSLTFDAVRATTTTTSIRGYDIDVSINGGAYTDLGAANIANVRSDGLQSIRLLLSDAGVSTVDFRVRSTGGGIEWTNFAIHGGLSGTAQIHLSVAQDGANLDFSWNSKGGMLYDLVWSETLDSDPSGWPPVAGQTGIAADPSGTTATSIPLSGDAKTFYAVLEYPAPLVELLNEDFDANNGRFTQDDASAGSGTPWTWGAPDSDNGLSSIVSSGNGGPPSKCWATNLGTWDGGNGDAGFYKSTTDAGLRTPALDLTTSSAGTVEFAHAMDVNSGDTAVVNFLDADDGNAVLASVPFVDGDIDASPWANESISIPDGALGHNVIIEWRLSSIAATDYIGWYIDDVVISAN